MISKYSKRKRSSRPLSIILTILILLSVAFIEISGNLKSSSRQTVQEADGHEPVTVLVLDVPEVSRIEETRSLPFVPESILSLEFDHIEEEFSDNDERIVNSRLSEMPSITFPLQLLRSGYHSQVSQLIMFDHIGLLEIDQSTGYNLIHFLARSYQYTSMEWLLEWMYARRLDGINFNEFVNMKSLDCKGGDTPIHLAVTHPNRVLSYLLIDLLLRFQADPNIPNNSGQTAIDLAASHPDRNRIRALDRSMNIEANRLGYLNCVFGERGAPNDPIYWLIDGSTDTFDYVRSTGEYRFRR